MHGHWLLFSCEILILVQRQRIHWAFVVQPPETEQTIKVLLTFKTFGNRVINWLFHDVLGIVWGFANGRLTHKLQHTPRGHKHRPLPRYTALSQHAPRRWQENTNKMFTICSLSGFHITFFQTDIDLKYLVSCEGIPHNYFSILKRETCFFKKNLLYMYLLFWPNECSRIFKFFIRFQHQGQGRYVHPVTQLEMVSRRGALRISKQYFRFLPVKSSRSSVCLYTNPCKEPCCRAPSECAWSSSQTVPIHLTYQPLDVLMQGRHK